MDGESVSITVQNEQLHLMANEKKRMRETDEQTASSLSFISWLMGTYVKVQSVVSTRCWPEIKQNINISFLYISCSCSVKFEQYQYFAIPVLKCLVF